MVGQVCRQKEFQYRSKIFSLDCWQTRIISSNWKPEVNWNCFENSSWEQVKNVRWTHVKALRDLACPLKALNRWWLFFLPQGFFEFAYKIATLDCLHFTPPWQRSINFYKTSEIRDKFIFWRYEYGLSISELERQNRRRICSFDSFKEEWLSVRY